MEMSQEWRWKLLGLSLCPFLRSKFTGSPGVEEFSYLSHSSDVDKNMNAKAGGGLVRSWGLTSGSAFVFP